MFGSKYSNVLTIILVIVILVIIGLLAFWGYDTYRKYYISKEAVSGIEQFENSIKNNSNVVANNTITDNNVTVDLNEVIGSLNTIDNSSNNSNNNSSNSNTLKGFTIKGIIEIPKTSIKLPILEKVTTKSLETSVAILHPEGSKLNIVGNITIAGHNYRNGMFFSNNKKLSEGDKIYITDEDGNKVAYTIYKKYETTPEDAEYMNRDTNGAREITLTTCTDDSKARLILWAKADS